MISLINLITTSFSTYFNKQPLQDLMFNITFHYIKFFRYRIHTYITYDQSL